MSESDPYYIKIVEPPKPEFLFTFFTANNVLLARIRPNGEVEFGPGYTTDDELSRRVWQGLAHLPARLVQAEKERDEARSYKEQWLRAAEEERQKVRAEFEVWKKDHLNHEADDLRKRLEQQTDWHQQRFNRLRKWVKEEVEPLSKEVAHRYFSICANGSPAPHESADWTDTMHGLRLRAEQAERQRDEAREDLKDLEADFQKRQEAHKCSTWDDYMVKCHCESIMAQLKKERDEARASDAETLQLFLNNRERLDTVRSTLEAICHEFESTVAHADWLAAGSKGMSVPFHGDFASAVQLPSVISRMRSWVRTFKSALGREE